MQHIFGAEIGGLAPAFDDDAAVLRIESDEQAVAADGVPDGSQEVRMDSGGSEGRRTDDYFPGALLDQSTSALDRAHASTYPRGGFGRQHAYEIIVGAAAHGGIEVDHLNLRECGEAAQHLLGRIGLQSLLAALHQLDDFALHQVDAREDHAVFLTGTPCLSSSSLS